MKDKLILLIDFVDDYRNIHGEPPAFITMREKDYLELIQSEYFIAQSYLHLGRQAIIDYDVQYMFELIGLPQVKVQIF